MSNNWQQRPFENQNRENNTPVRRTGSLLRDYGQQPQPLPQKPPAVPQQLQSAPPQPQPMVPQQLPPAPQQPQPYSPMPMQGPPAPNPYSPMPSGPSSPRPITTPAPTSTPGWAANSPGWVANTVDMVRRLSGKMVAISRTMQQPQQPPAPPMVVYHPPSLNSGDLIQTKSRPWRRSRALRIAMMKRRERGTQTSLTPMKIAGGVLLVFMLLVVISVSSGSAYAYGYYQSQLPRLQQIANLRISQTTRIYDRNGTLLTEKYDPNAGGRRIPIAYKDIPQVMKDAMTSAEDPTFWTNSGVDPQGITRAATNYITHQGIDGGGSTLTQQVIKNMTGDDQQSIINRKIPEAALAIGMTNQFPKWKVLEMYFNVAGFASQDMGVEAAVEEFFKLSPTCDIKFNCKPGITQLNYNYTTKKNDPLLGLARASLLAGMPQNPNGYDPTLGPTNKQNALNRQVYVLNQMIHDNITVDGLGKVTPQIAQQAEALTAKMTFTRYQPFTKAPHFVDWIVTQVAMMLGNGNYTAGLPLFETGGFNIRTSIDLNLETYVENAVKRHLTVAETQQFTGLYVVTKDYNNLNDAAVVVLNAKTGEILAMDGSLAYNSNEPTVSGQINMAAQRRQPGSTFKPIVYATAFEMGMYPGTVLPDYQTFFPNGGGVGMTENQTYHPTDYGNKYNNQNSTIRMATANSFNIPALKAESFAGVDNVLNTAYRMGMTDIHATLNALRHSPTGCAPTATDAQCARLPLAIGSVEVSPLQMTGAYQTFADQGKHVPPQGILDIWDNYGHNLYHFDPAHPQESQVLSPQVAYMMTSVLTDQSARSFEFGNVRTLSFWDWTGPCSMLPWSGMPTCPYDVAAKTGTTDDFKDNWTIGYTPNVVVGVWTGNANNVAMTNNPTGITGAAPIWNSVIEYATGRPCGEIDPQIACPAKPFNAKSLNLNQPPNFVQPDGLQKVCSNITNTTTTTKNGKTKNKTTTTTACDWALQGQVAQQVDNNGNNNDNGNNNNNGNNNDNGNNNGNNNDNGNNNNNNGNNGN
jgi:membrane peptidoglycan carboxypeptidase